MRSRTRRAALAHRSRGGIQPTASDTHLPDGDGVMSRVLYCHCAFARVIPPPTKSAVLAYLSATDLPFDAVPDLCEMSARRDERLQGVAGSTPVVIVACYERAVRGLFHSAGAALPADGVTVLNMRTDAPDVVTRRIDELVHEPRTTAEASS